MSHTGLIGGDKTDTRQPMSLAPRIDSWIREGIITTALERRKPCGEKRTFENGQYTGARPHVSTMGLLETKRKY